MERGEEGTPGPNRVEGGPYAARGKGGSVPSILLLSFVGKRDESAKGRGEERLEGEEGGGLDGCQTRVSRHPGKKDE